MPCVCIYHNQQVEIRSRLTERFAPNFYRIGSFQEKGEIFLLGRPVPVSLRAQKAGPVSGGAVELEAWRSVGIYCTGHMPQVVRYNEGIRACNPQLPSTYVNDRYSYWSSGILTLSGLYHFCSAGLRELAK
jgi:hypothetical protein